MKNKIDFVITWVDGNDPKWLEEKHQYDGKKEIHINNSDYRYKDWGLLRYWFRGVEKYAPWVNKIYFITWGHLPKWLDTSNPKLVIINHKDYIPKKYLPTFNSNVIELNINRIKDLSENFVLFNDDMYLISNTKPTDFFKDNKPCDSMALNVHCQKKSMIIQNICNNNVSIINEYFDFKKTFKKNLFKWFNLKNGKMLLRTIALMNCPRYPGFTHAHIPVSHKKSTFDELWEKEFELLDNTSSHKFREASDINHWLMEDWYIVSGNVMNRFVSFGKVFFIRSDINKKQEQIINYITKHKGKTICLNDSDLTDENYEKVIPNIVGAFEKIMPEKSSFEK